MYIFIFIWTPTLDEFFENKYSHSFIFSCFMISVMIGSSFSSLLLSNFKGEVVLLISFLISCFFLFFPVIFNNGEKFF
jgi:fucose permease